MTDTEARQLLALLHRYVSEYSSCTDMAISEVADDLVRSMDNPTARDEQFNAEIESAVTPR